MATKSKGITVRTTAGKNARVEPVGGRDLQGQRVVVGTAKRAPRLNFDGTPAEDMQAGDKPPSSSRVCGHLIPVLAQRAVHQG